MTRKKLKLAWIANDDARKASLMKRRLGLLKKVSKLATLCGVKAGVIIYRPDKNEPGVWPSQVKVQQVLASFNNMPKLERLKKMTNQETYLRERVAKGQKHQIKYQRRNKEVEMGHLMHQINQGKGLDELNLKDLRGLTWLVEEKMKEMRKRFEFFEQVPFPLITRPHHGDLSLLPQDTADDLTAQINSVSASLGRDGGTPTESLLLDQWFNNMINNNELKSTASSNSIKSVIGLLYHAFASRVADNLGLPRHSFCGSSSVAADMGLSQYGNFIGLASDMGLPPLSFRSYGGTTDIGLLHANAGSSTFGPFRSDMGLRLHPLTHGKRLQWK